MSNEPLIVKDNSNYVNTSYGYNTFQGDPLKTAFDKINILIETLDNGKVNLGESETDVVEFLATVVGPNAISTSTTASQFITEEDLSYSVSNGLIINDATFTGTRPTWTDSSGASPVTKELLTSENVPIILENSNLFVSELLITNAVFIDEAQIKIGEDYETVASQEWITTTDITFGGLIEARNRLNNITTASSVITQEDLDFILADGQFIENYLTTGEEKDIRNAKLINNVASNINDTDTFSDVITADYLDRYGLNNLLTEDGFLTDITETLEANSNFIEIPNIKTNKILVKNSDTELEPFLIDSGKTSIQTLKITNSLSNNEAKIKINNANSQEVDFHIYNNTTGDLLLSNNVAFLKLTQISDPVVNYIPKIYFGRWRTELSGGEGGIRFGDEFEVLHKGNMGSGSGINADLLDGHDSTDFLIIGDQDGGRLTLGQAGNLIGGLNVEFLNGYTDTAFLKKDENEVITGNYTFEGEVIIENSASENLKIKGSTENLTVKVDDTFTEISYKADGYAPFGPNVLDPKPLFISNLTGGDISLANGVKSLTLKGNGDLVKADWDETTKTLTNEVKVWNEDNMGVNSGLDADLFHGEKPSYYLNLSNFYTNRPEGNTIFVSSTTGDDENYGFTETSAVASIEAGVINSLLIKTNDSKRRDAGRIIERNRDIIINEALGYISANYPTSCKNTRKSKRDLNLIYDSLVKDFIYSKGDTETNYSNYFSILSSTKLKQVFGHTGSPAIGIKNVVNNILKPLIRKAISGSLTVTDFNNTSIVENNIYKSHFGEPSLDSCDYLSTNIENIANDFVADIQQNLNNPASPVTVKELEADNNSPTTIYLESGDYEVNKVLVVPDNVSIIGDNLRRVSIYPSVELQKESSGLFLRLSNDITKLITPEFEWLNTSDFDDGLLVLKELDGSPLTLSIREKDQFIGIELSGRIPFDLRRGDVLRIKDGVKETFVRVGATVSSGSTSIPIIPHKFKQFGNEGDTLQVGSEIHIACRPEWISNIEGTFLETLDYIKPITTLETNETIVGSHMFQVGDGFYFTGAKIVNHSNFAFAFRRDKPKIYASPYIQNCTSLSTVGGGGCEVDGTLPLAPDDNIPNNVGLTNVESNNRQVTEIRSFVMDAFTQLNTFGGYGHLIKNNGYAQLVSTFTIFNDIGVKVESGGLCNLSNSVTNFGHLGLVADGLSKQHYLKAKTSQDILGVPRGLPPAREIYISVDSLELNPENPVFNLNSKYGEFFDSFNNIDFNGIDKSLEKRKLAKRLIQFNSTIVFKSNYQNNGASVSEVLPRLISKVELNEESSSFAGDPETDLKITFKTSQRIPDQYALLENATVEFYITSTITSSGHGFEYIGSGNDYSTALPESGGIPNQSNKALETAGGKIFLSSTDVTGNFAVGDFFEINQSTGEIRFSPTELELNNIKKLGPFVESGVSNGIVINDLTNSSELTNSGFPRPDVIPTSSAVAGFFNKNTAKLLADAEEALEVSFQNNFVLSTLTNPITDLGSWAFRHSIYHRGNPEINYDGSTYNWDDRIDNIDNIFKLPTFTDEFNSSTDLSGNSINDTGLNLFKNRAPFTINLVMDTSNSMASTGEFWKLKQSLISFCYNFQLNDSIVFYLFNSSNDLLKPNIFSYRQSAIFSNRPDARDLMRNSLLKFIGSVFPEANPYGESYLDDSIIDISSLDYVPPKSLIKQGSALGEYSQSDIQQWNGVMTYNDYLNSDLAVPLSSFQARNTSEIDFVLLLDTSGSMSQEIESVKNALSQFIESLLTSGVEAYFAIVSTADLYDTAYNDANGISGNGSTFPHVYNFTNSNIDIQFDAQGELTTKADEDIIGEKLEVISEITDEFDKYFSNDINEIKNVLTQIAANVEVGNSGDEDTVAGFSLASALPFSKKAQKNIIVLSDEPPTGDAGENTFDSDDTNVVDAKNRMNDAGIDFLHLLVNSDDLFNEKNTPKTPLWDTFRHEINQPDPSDSKKLPGILAKLDSNEGFSGLSVLIEIASVITDEQKLTSDENIITQQGNYPPGYTLYKRNYNVPAILATPGTETTTNNTQGITVGGKTALYESVSIAVNDLLEVGESKTLQNTPNLFPRNPLKNGTINIVSILTDGEDNDSFKNFICDYKFISNTFTTEIQDKQLDDSVTDGNYKISYTTSSGIVDVTAEMTSSTVEDVYNELIQLSNEEPLLQQDGWNIFIEIDKLVVSTTSNKSVVFSAPTGESFTTPIEFSSDITAERNRVFEACFINYFAVIYNFTINKANPFTSYSLEFQIFNGTPETVTYNSVSGDSIRKINEELAELINENSTITESGWRANIGLNTLVIKNEEHKTGIDINEAGGSEFTKYRVTDFVTTDINNNFSFKPVKTIYTQEILKFYRASENYLFSNNLDWRDVPNEYAPPEALDKATDELGFIVPRFSSPDNAIFSPSFPNKLRRKGNDGSSIPNYYIFEAVTDESNLFSAVVGPPISILLSGITNHIEDEFNNKREYVDINGTVITNLKSVENNITKIASITKSLRLFSKLGYLSELTNEVYNSGKLGFVVLDPGFNKDGLYNSTGIFARDLSNYNGLYFLRSAYGADTLLNSVTDNGFTVIPTQTISSQKENLFNAFNRSILTTGVPIVKREEVYPHLMEAYPKLPFATDEWLKETFLGINQGKIKALPYNVPVTESDFKWSSKKYQNPDYEALLSLDGSFDNSDEFIISVTYKNNSKQDFLIDPSSSNKEDYLNDIETELIPLNTNNGWDITPITNDSGTTTGITIKADEKITLNNISNEILIDKPIAFWGLDQDPSTTLFVDYAGDYPLSKSGTFTSQNSLVTFGKALASSGNTNDKLYTTNPTLLAELGNDFTIELWIDKDSSNDGYAINLADNSNNTLSLKIGSNAVTLLENDIEVLGDNNPDINQSDGQKYHVAIVKSSIRGLELWISGELVDSDVSKTLDYSTIEELTLFNNKVPSNPINENIILDDVVIFDYPLAANRIQDHFSSGRSVFIGSNLISFYCNKSVSGIVKLKAVSYPSNRISLPKILQKNKKSLNQTI